MSDLYRFYQLLDYGYLYGLADDEVREFLDLIRRLDPANTGAYLLLPRPSH